MSPYVFSLPLGIYEYRVWNLRMQNPNDKQRHSMCPVLEFCNPPNWGGYTTPKAILTVLNLTYGTKVAGRTHVELEVSRAEDLFLPALYSHSCLCIADAGVRKGCGHSRFVAQSREFPVCGTKLTRSLYRYNGVLCVQAGLLCQ